METAPAGQSILRPTVKADRQTILNFDAKLAVTPLADGKPATISGYALVWNVLSSDRGGYRVRLLPGSARFADEVHALWHHEFRDVLGTTANGTLRISPDSVGVRVEIDLPNTNAGRDVAELIRRGDVRGMSFGMVDLPTGEKVKESGQSILNAASYVVDEVTVTAIPAFSEAMVGIKDANAPAALVGYSARTAHKHTLDKFRLQSLRLPGAEYPCSVA